MNKHSETPRTRSLIRTKSLPVLFIILQIIGVQSYAQLSAADKAKMDSRKILSKIQLAEADIKANDIKESVAIQNLDASKQDSLLWVAKKDRHNANPVIWDQGKKKPQAAIDFDNEKQVLLQEYDAIIKKSMAIRDDLGKVRQAKIVLKNELLTQKQLLKHKATELLVNQLFNASNCGPVPSEKSGSILWKAWLDCMFDGTRMNQPVLVNPANPGQMKVFANDPSAVIVPDNDPAASQKKQDAIRRMIEKSKQDNVPVQPLVVPSPTAGNSSSNSGSFSDALHNIFKNLTTQQSGKSAGVSSVRD